MTGPSLLEEYSPWRGELPPKQRPIALWITLAVLALITLAACIGAVVAAVTSEEPLLRSGADGFTSGSPDQPGDSDHAVGELVRDGSVEFTVQKVVCGLQLVGADARSKSAHGQYCLVALSVKNNGGKPQSLSAEQHGFDTEGQRHDLDAEATRYANQTGTAALLQPIAPGKAAVGVLAFDIPAGAQLVELELRASGSSAGAKIRL